MSKERRTCDSSTFTEAPPRVSLSRVEQGKYQHLQELILEVSNASHYCGQFDMENDFITNYDKLLEKAETAEKRLFDYVVSLVDGEKNVS